MDTSLYYFSGTGNSLVVASDLAAYHEASLAALSAALEDGRPTPQTQTVGVLFPVYYAGLPPVVRRFIEAVELSPEVYFFVVCTYGGGIGNAVREARQLLRARSLELAAAFGVHMPQNAFFKAWENRQKIEAQRRRKLQKISAFIRLRRRGMLHRDRIALSLLAPIHLMITTQYRKGLARLGGGSQAQEREELIHHADRSFGVLEACNGCGICRRVCPVANIDLVEHRPVWQHRCENCLACYTWCPQQAITSGIVQQGYRYHHPQVSLSDMLPQGAVEHRESRRK